MSSKLIIFVFILFYFDLVLVKPNPVVEPEKLYEKYGTKILERGLNTTVLEICDFTIIQWINVCKTAISFLRNEIPKYNHLLYVNQNSFNNIASGKCKVVQVKLIPKIFPDKESAQQIVLSCYCAPSVIPLNTELKNYIFYDKIVIYPATMKEMMLFEKNDNADDYTLVGWMTPSYWTRVSKSKTEFNYPIPKVLVGMNAGLAKYFSDQRNHHIRAQLLYMNTHMEHILFKILPEMRLHLCSLMFRRLEYVQHFVPYRSTSTIIEVETKLERMQIVLSNEQILEEDLEQSIELIAFRCGGQKKNAKNIYEYTNEYKLTTGLRLDEVILLKTKVVINKTEYNEPIEIIGNVISSYIYFTASEK